MKCTLLLCEIEIVASINKNASAKEGIANGEGYRDELIALQNINENKYAINIKDESNTAIVQLEKSITNHQKSCRKSCRKKNSSYFEEICAQISGSTDPNPARNGVGFRCSGGAVHALFDQISFPLHKET